MLNLFLRTAVFSVAMALSFPVFAQIDSVGSAINKSGRQRMLTQRILKAYCEVGQDESYSFHDAAQQLNDAISLFDQQLSELEAFASDEATRSRLQTVRELWHPYREIATASPSRDGAVKMLEMDDDLLRSAHRVVLALEDLSGTESGRLVNISGRQRMLSQRLAKFYILDAWDFRGADFDAKKNQTLTEFEGGLAVLTRSKLNTPEINKLLAQVEGQWTFFKDRLELSRIQSTPMLVGITAEKLLAQLNELTRLYEELTRG